MSDTRENLPLDARLLSEAIHELNIARRNVSIYPKDHPIVEKSLQKCYECLEKLFELRNDITLSVAKDTLVVDDFFLDKNHPVFRDFALCLNAMSIASLTFLQGMVKTEVYDFLRFLVDSAKESSAEVMKAALREYSLPCIRVEFIDYDAFSFNEGQSAEGEASDELIWERYVSGLKDGRLKTSGSPEDMKEISPEKLAALLNRSEAHTMKEESYDKVITAYLRKSSERAFSGSDLRKIMDFINNLRPELKKQFLSSALRNFSHDIEEAESSLRGISANEVLLILGTINEQKIAIPEALRNLLGKFSRLNQDSFRTVTVKGAEVADDILLSDEVIGLLREGNFEKFVSATYQQEIKKLLDLDSLEAGDQYKKEFKAQLSDEFIESTFNATVVELISSDLPDFIAETDYDTYFDLLRMQVEQFLDTGRYGLVLRTFNTLRSNIKENRLAEINVRADEYFHSSEFIGRVMGSLSIMGRLMRDDAIALIDHYGKEIIPSLMDALAEEESPSTRGFLITLITHFGDAAVPETLRRLRDSRWFVQRNMLLIMQECDNGIWSSQIRVFCNSDNAKVSMQAIKCLLKTGDKYAVEALRRNLNSRSREIVNRAVILSGAYRIRELVPDLIRLLGRTALSGTDYQDKLPVVRALGMIGDSRAVQPLKDLLRSKSILFKSAAERLKAEVSLTLGRYFPREKIGDRA